MPVIEWFIEFFSASADAALLTPETYGKTKENPPKWWQILTKQRIRRARKKADCLSKLKNNIPASAHKK